MLLYVSPDKYNKNCGKRIKLSFSYTKEVGIVIVVIVLFLALCMFSFLPKVKKNYSPVNNGNLINREENPLDGATTTCLKGIFAIVIVMHHFAVFFSEIGMPFFFQKIFERAGASGVGVFLCYPPLD